MPAPLPGARYARICTLDRAWCVHEVRGAVFVSWVSRADRAHATSFPLERADQWVVLLEGVTGLELMFEEI